MQNNIYPVILCGGQGSRLWPLSRKAMPKQFANLNGEYSLLQDTVKRMEEFGFMPPLMITNEAYRFTVREQLESINNKSATILIEPEPRNTAPAVCASAEFLKAQDEEGLMLIVPSDHVIHEQKHLLQAITAGIEKAKEGHVVTFGIRPDRAETGFGYMELSDVKSENGKPQKCVQFIEKPNMHGAQKMLNDGSYVWNAGIFLLSVKTAFNLFEEYHPKILEHARSAVENLKYDLGFSRFGDSFKKMPDLSFDVGIMEKEPGYVVPVNPGWNDLGSWRAVWHESDKDHFGVAKSDNALAIECEDCLIRSENEDLAIVGVGLKNITAIATRDAVLISDMDSTQSVSLAVNAMKEKGIKQAEEFPRHYRPWGYYETLSLGSRFQVKSIVVKPGGKLSLQSHIHRAEHWIVVEGAATVTVGEARKLIGENASIYIPQGEVHRLENEGKLPLQLIEVQTGCYLGEDDIIRYEDVYARA
jgi:mannose-1-phosphate guanylyltransferase/mannose-6-phosphate isomerase